MKSLYVGCALKCASEEFVASVAALKKRLSEHYEIAEFVGLDYSVSAETVYITDITCATEADIMLAICDVPSTGLGMEVQRRIELGKETYLAYQNESKISRMLLGAAAHYSFVHEIAYNSLAELPLPLVSK